MTAPAARTGPERPRTAPTRGLPRLLIADDDNVIQTALYMQLSRDFEIVGSARNADEAIELAERHQPDVAILDVQMPGGGGLRATREIHARVPGIAIVALSSDESDTVVMAMLEAGAVTYVRKGRPGHELASLLRTSIAAHVKLTAV
jgi:DNA-binding NarL/FixJ family response regulator